jgi:hypothetical protein
MNILCYTLNCCEIKPPRGTFATMRVFLSQNATSVSWCSEDDSSEGFKSLDQVYTPVAEW